MKWRLINFKPCSGWTKEYLIYLHWKFGPRKCVCVHLCSWLKDIVFSLSYGFFRSPLHGDALLLYRLLKVIGALHLLIIWTFTWVPVPSDILPTSLWVAVAKVTLFAYLLHINAARKVASLHLMRQLWSPPRHPILFSFSRLCEAYPYYQYSFGVIPHYG